MNCKPGDLALIVRDVDYPENLGKFVTVLRRSQWESPGEVLWCCSPQSPLRGDICYEDGEVHTVGVLGTADIDYSDEELRAIRPGDISDEEVRDLYSPEKETA